MGRRGRSSPTISLFSFQDIITSVTGIIILVTLMLSLQLIHRKLLNVAPASTSASPEVQTAISTARLEIDRLQQRLDEAAEHSLDLAKATPIQLRQEITEVAAQSEALDAEVAELRKSSGAATAKQQSVQAVQKSNAPRYQRLNELKSAAAEARRKITEAKADNRRVYNRSPGASKTAWLLDVSGTRIVAARLGERGTKVEFNSSSDSLRLNELLKWATGRDRASEYFLLLIRPSGISAFKKLQEGLEAKGFELGFDLASETQVVAAEGGEQ